MLAFVHHEARLNARQVDGSTLRATFEEKARRGQLTPAGLLAFNGPERPDALSYLYQWFQELSRCRSASMGGISPITFGDVAAWARLTDNRPRPHEVDAIMALDAEWRVAIAGEPSSTDKQATAVVATRTWPAPKTEVM